MIIGIDGGLGSGKTLLMTRYLIKDSLRGNKIMANFGLKGIDYTSLNITDLLQKKANLKNVSVGIDELTVFADCRRAMSNTIFSYFILQTRKRNVCLYFTTQDFAMVDKRVIRHTYILIHCEKIANYPEHRRFSIVDRRDDYFAEPVSFTMNITPYFKHFDTNEIIEPI